MRRPETAGKLRGKLAISFRLLAEEIELVLLVTSQKQCYQYTPGNSTNDAQ
jgi:hypothetical protein